MTDPGSNKGSMADRGGGGGGGGGAKTNTAS